ncbi:MAG: flippase-like domain-containing protein [Bacteroidaceae bacterium]|nr:flippase-like domain-containing protein [Bacteroidaceae bacterium]
MKSKTRNIFFAFGLFAVIVMLFTFKVSFTQLWADICHAGYWLFAILGLWIFLYMMNAWTWRIIIRGSGDCPIPFWKILKLTITGFALNYATPAGLMGGEPYKIMELKPYIGTQRATSSVLLFAMMHIFAHFWFWTTSIAVYLVLAAFGILPINVGMGIVLLFMTCFCGAGIYLFMRGYKNGMVVKLIRFISHIPGCKKWGRQFAESHQEDLMKIDRQISQLQSQNQRSFFGSFALEFIGRILQSLEIYFMLLLFEAGTGGGLTFVYAFLILSFTSLFANLLFFLPLQLGGREGGFAMSVAQMGMTADIGMFVSIICRVRELFWTAIGLLLMKVGNKLPISETTEQTTPV